MAKMLVENSIALAIITIIMSIPLFLSYNIKHVLFPEGLPFVFLFSWGLLSVFLVDSNILQSTTISTSKRIGKRDGPVKHPEVDFLC